MSRPARGTSTAELLGGASFLRHNRRVLCLMGVMVVAMAGRPWDGDLAPCVRHQDLAHWRRRLRASEDGSWASCLVAGLGLWFRALGGTRGRLSVCFVVAAVCFSVFGGDPPFALALVVLAAGTLALTVAMACAGSEVQQSVPDFLRGRTSAITSMGQNGLAGLGAVAVAAAAARAGAGVAVAGMAGLVCVLGIALLTLASRPRPGPPARQRLSTGQSGAP